MDNSGYPKSPEELYRSEASDNETIWIGNTSYLRSKGFKTLTPADHMEIKGYEPIQNSTPEYLVKNPSEHFTRDVNLPGEEDYPVQVVSYDGTRRAVNSGSTTHRNPFSNPEVEKMQKDLASYDIEDVREKLGNPRAIPPLSPIHPFMYMSPTEALTNSFRLYNRTKIPDANIAFRKGFRHIFFTRPECYIMSFGSDGVVLSEQCTNDEDFQSSFMRMPHISMLLSPSYVTGTVGYNGTIPHNWNFLLSNMVQGMGNTDEKLNLIESTSFQLPSGTLDSIKGSTISLTFNETRNLDVYEFIRMWILYIYKVARGYLLPSYNGYQYKNAFTTESTNSQKFRVTEKTTKFLHPYDRALDYPCSLFNFVTDETGCKIISWEKYFGLFPISVSLKMENQKNGPITSTEGLQVTAEFAYQYREQNRNRTFIEFNYNAGICDRHGNPWSTWLPESLSFLVKDTDDAVLPKYIGAAGMFTGSPFVVMGSKYTGPDIGTKVENTYAPYLKFLPTDYDLADLRANMGIVNHQINTERYAGLR
jgi:hypothetical protein